MRSLGPFTNSTFKRARQKEWFYFKGFLLTQALIHLSGVTHLTQQERPMTEYLTSSRGNCFTQTRFSQGKPLKHINPDSCIDTLRAVLQRPSFKISAGFPGACVASCFNEMRFQFQTVMGRPWEWEPGRVEQQQLNTVRWLSGGFEALICENAYISIKMKTSIPLLVAPDQYFQGYLYYVCRKLEWVLVTSTSFPPVTVLQHLACWEIMHCFHPVWGHKC